MSADTVKLVDQKVKEITHGVQIVKRKEWFERLGYDHPLYPIIAMCLQDNPHERWELEEVRTEMNEMSSKPPPKLIDVLRQNEVLREEILQLTDKTREDVTKVDSMYKTVFLISLYGTPLAQRASYFVLHSSLFEPVLQLIIIILSLTALTLCSLAQDVFSTAYTPTVFEPIWPVLQNLSKNVVQNNYTCTCIL